MRVGIRPDVVVEIASSSWSSVQASPVDSVSVTLSCPASNPSWRASSWAWPQLLGTLKPLRREADRPEARPACVVCPNDGLRKSLLAPACGTTQLGRVVERDAVEPRRRGGERVEPQRLAHLLEEGDRARRGVVPLRRPLFLRGRRRVLAGLEVLRPVSARLELARACSARIARRRSPGSTPSRQGRSAGTSESARMRISIQLRFVSVAMTRYLNPWIRTVRRCAYRDVGPASR